MTYKAARNKALAGASRLIRARYHGELWTTDAYFAIKGDMFSDYKPRKDQEIVSNEPVMDLIIDGREYIFAEFEKPNPENDLDTLIFENNAIAGKWEVQRRYVEAVRAYFPDALPHVPINGDIYGPVAFKIAREIVAVVMPLKQ